jgi:hypothetical protein
VQVAFQPLAFLAAGFDHLEPRVLELLQPCPQVGLQTPGLHGDAGCRDDGVEQLMLLLERAVEDQGGHGLVVVQDQPCRQGVALGGEGDGLAGLVDPRELRQPVGDRQCRIV